MVVAVAAKSSCNQINTKTTLSSELMIKTENCFNRIMNSLEKLFENYIPRAICYSFATGVFGYACLFNRELAFTFAGKFSLGFSILFASNALIHSYFYFKQH